MHTKKNKKFKITRLIMISTLAVLSLIFILLNIFYRNGWTTNNIIGKYGFLLFTLSIIVPGIGYGISSSTIQFASKNILASPTTIGIFPAISFSYLFSNIWNFQSNYLLRYFIALILTIAVLGIYFYIDKKTNTSNKIIFSFVISAFLSALSVLLYARVGLQKEGSLLFSINNLDFVWEKFYIGLASLLVGLIIYFFISKKIYLISFNEELAISQGINVNLIKMFAFLFTAIVVNGAYISFGFVAFLGILIPNIGRMLGFEKLNSNAIFSSLVIMLFLLLAYFVSREILFDFFATLMILIIPITIPLVLYIRKRGIYA
ncbi:MAG: iron ABC transporter permease [Mycoplasma sp.]|nr:iron ABC transporter permease [Mycoplasma sp.]